MKTQEIKSRISMKRIRELSDRITREFHPERIVLFGSHAYGKPAKDSDVDLLVVLRFEGKGARKAAEILNTVSPGFPVDLIARTPEEYCQRLEWNDFFLREIDSKGKVLYESAHR